jgi:hypothetical protein
MQNFDGKSRRRKPTSQYINVCSRILLKWILEEQDEDMAKFMQIKTETRGELL